MFVRKIFLSLIIGAFLITATAHAEIQTYSGSGQYFMTDETIDFAKNKAELDAQRNVLEKICVYINSQTEINANVLENDEIITVSAGILRIVDTKFSMEPDDAGITVKALVTAEIDSDELKTLLERAINERKGE